MSDRAPQDQDKFVVRLPAGLRERIKEAADANNRSMNSEIVACIEWGLRAGAFFDLRDDGEQSEVLKRSMLIVSLEDAQHTLGAVSRYLAGLNRRETSDADELAEAHATAMDRLRRA